MAKTSLPTRRTLLSLAAKHGFYIPHSCKDGLCNSCEIQVKAKGSDKFANELACQYIVEQSVVCTAQRMVDRKLPDEQSFPLKLSRIKRIDASHYLVVLRHPPTITFEYLCGQFVDIGIAGKGVRSYSIFDYEKNELSLFITKITGGVFSNFLTSEENIGKRINLRGPKGTSLPTKS